MKNVHPEVFRLYNSVKADNDDKKLINELLLWNRDIPEATKDILHKILGQASEVYESLTPLIELGVTFDIWLVGGAVRDLLLGNGELIKDLDILISFDQAKKPEIPTRSIFMKKTRFDFDFNLEQLQPVVFPNGKNERPFSHWKVLSSKEKSNDIRYKKKLAFESATFDMIACGLGQKFDLYELYKPSTSNLTTLETSNQYLDLRLKGVIKIRKDTWAWPMDILISHYNIDSFLGAFDFGICKVGMELVRGSDVRQQRFEFPKTPNDLLKRIRLTSHFLKDVKAKHLSTVVSSVMSLRQVKHSLEKHLVQLEKKYPWSVKAEIETDFDLDDFSVEESNNKKEIETYLRSFFLQRRLDKSLAKGDVDIVKSENRIRKIKKI